MKKLITALCLLPTLSYAADMPVKARVAQPFIGYPYDGSGFYYGIGTFGEAQQVQVSTPTIVGTRTYAAGAGVSLIGGWQWTLGPTKWVALEGTFNYANTGANCNVGTCSVNARYSASQKIKFGGPIAAMLAYIPDLSTAFPVLPPVPAGATNPLTHPYAMAVLHESQDEIAMLTTGRKAIKVRGGVGLGLLTQVKDGMVIDTWAEYTFRTGSLSVTPGTTSEAGGQARVGMSVLY